MSDELKTVTLAELIEMLLSGDQHIAQDISLRIGLILEKETEPNPAQFNQDIRAVLGDEFHYVRPSRAEIYRAIDRLINYIEHADLPVAGAVWALTKCRSRRILRPLVRLLKRTMVSDDPMQAHVANQAFHGVALFKDKIALHTIKIVSNYGAESIKECAVGYLAVHRKWSH